ncbi:hypothetical protein MMC30_003803 [Trapelia coarctata]|nr:hypothetical protein [Trapelia coarctata]
MPPTNRITALATLIAQNTAIIDTYLTTNNLPTPSLDANCPAKLPIAEEAVEVVAARAAVIEATDELQALMMGPLELLKVDYTKFISLHAITRFNLARALPVGEETSYSTLAQASGLEEHTLRCLLRHGMVHHLFHEPSPGRVAHTGLTAQLAKDEMLHAWVENALGELWPAAAKTVDALTRWPASQEPTETGFALANNASQSIWEIFSAAPSRGAKFARSMSFMSDVRGYAPHHLLNAYPWASLGAGTVVDVGGSHGSIMLGLAARFPSLKCVVQDLAATVAEGEKLVPAELTPRVAFMAQCVPSFPQIRRGGKWGVGKEKLWEFLFFMLIGTLLKSSSDFFTPQPVTADVYYFRWIFHNWSDQYCIQILRNLIPALQPGARIVVNEFVMPEPGTLGRAEERVVRYVAGLSEEVQMGGGWMFQVREGLLSSEVADVFRRCRNMDVVMLMLLNAQERDEVQWANLFRRADERFRYLGARRPEGAVLSIIEVAWEGSLEGSY